MAASSKHHVRNRILGGLGAVILVVVGLFMWQKTKVQLYDDPNTTGNTAGNLLNGGGTIPFYLMPTHYLR